MKTVLTALATLTVLGISGQAMAQKADFKGEARVAYSVNSGSSLWIVGEAAVGLFRMMEDVEAHDHKNGETTYSTKMGKNYICSIPSGQKEEPLCLFYLVDHKKGEVLTGSL